MNRTWITSLLCLVIGMGLSLQIGISQERSSFDPDKLWDPLFYPHNGNEYRSASGAPGAMYWQNRADYEISGTLSPSTHRFTGEVKIFYTNNSPDALPYVWLQMDQNSGKEDSRSVQTGPHVFDLIVDGNFTQGFELNSVRTKQGGEIDAPDYIVDDTRMQIRLNKPVEAKGGKLEIIIEYEFEIPKFGARMGWVESDYGIVYDMGQWYPRMAVYDDIMGWNTLPYLGVGEFYLEYGDIDYKVTVPASMLVAGSGELLNPDAVFTEKEQKGLAKAYKSDETVIIYSTEDVKNDNLRKLEGMRTWHFRCTQTRDVAWTASDVFAWDAARINLPNGKTALAQTMYPPDADWARSTEYIKAVIEHFSEWLDFSFPYPVATNTVAGWGGGMEYPGIVFNSIGAKDSRLFGLVNHEFGHTWFPMIVGSNERRHMWQDEGTNSFINDEMTKIFNDGEYYDERFQRASRPGMFNENADQIVLYADALKAHTLGLAGYGKPALGLKLLREVILGPERFDYALQIYIKNWAYKHPGPYDFFRSFENAAGEDLSWFWNGFYFNNYAFDVAIDTVSSINGHTSGARIKISNKGQLALPLEVKLLEENGKEHVKNLPVEIWRRSGTIELDFPTTTAVQQVILDPESKLPDMDRDNNFWHIKLSPAHRSSIDPDNILIQNLRLAGAHKDFDKVKEVIVEYKGSIGRQAAEQRFHYKHPDYFTARVEGGWHRDSLIIRDKYRSAVRGYTQKKLPDIFNLNQLSPSELLIPETSYLGTEYKKKAQYIIHNGGLAVQIEILGPHSFKTINIYDPETGQKLQSSNEFNGLSQSTAIYSGKSNTYDLNFPQTIYVPESRSFMRLESVKVIR